MQEKSLKKYQSPEVNIAFFEESDVLDVIHSSEDVRKNSDSSRWDTGN